MPQLKIEDSKCHSKDPAQPNKYTNNKYFRKRNVKERSIPLWQNKLLVPILTPLLRGVTQGLATQCVLTWDVSDRDTSGHFKCSCPVHLTFLHFRDHMKRIYLVCPLVSSEQQMLRINLNPLHDLESSQIQPDPGQNSEAWARNKCLSLFPTMVFVVGCSIAIAN